MDKIVKRAITDTILEYIQEKIIIIGGPRQCGKTFLSKELLLPNHQYFNFDEQNDRNIITQKSWSRKTDLLIFDEIHKMPKWKTWLKGIYDTEGIPPGLLVTGSARLDTFKKGGDSLAGRHLHFRLHPFSIKEVSDRPDKKIIQDMMTLGQFPEPLLSGNERKANLWRKNHLERIIKEDLLDLEKIRELKKVEILTQLLSERVGSQINYASLGRDLEVSIHTIKHWIQVLENLNVIFIVTPYSKNIAKSILKAQKIYFYDTGRVRGDIGPKLENLTATHLLKRNHFLEDTMGEKLDLHYIKDVEKREVDFLTIRDYKPEHLIEVKLSDDNLSRNLKYFDNKIKPISTQQLVFDLKKDKQYENIYITDLTNFLHQLET